MLTEFGKREPNGTTRFITLFDFNTQAIVAQQQISGPAGQYTYQSVAQPIWLTSGTQYILTLYQGASDGYYFGASNQINPKLSYGDMRYCNSCTQSTFPTNILSNYHYGYPDFNFRTKQSLTPAPTYVINAQPIGGTVAGLVGSGLVLSLNAGSTQTLNISADGGFAFPVAVASAQTYTVAVQTQPSSPSQSCSVTNGSGTVASTPITNVTVTCTTNTYTIGGSVSGLSGSGLVLSLNSGAQTLNVSANGAFTFPTPINSGASYVANVQTQPNTPTQTCNVTSGAGTVGAANVTDIVVSCTTNTYTVGGSVSGLAGSGLVLSLNAGSQTLNIPANGAFTFPIAISSGSNYAVTVQTQPSARAQTCAVTSGTGIVSAANISDVSVTCGALLRNITLALPVGVLSTSPQVPATVPDGQTLSFTINVAPGYQLVSASGCGGTLNGLTYTTPAITSDCSISVQAIAVAPQIVPTGISGLWLIAMLAFVVGFALRRQRSR